MFRKRGYARSRTPTFLHAVCMAKKLPTLPGEGVGLPHKIVFQAFLCWPEKLPLFSWFTGLFRRCCSTSFELLVDFSKCKTNSRESCGLHWKALFAWHSNICIGQRGIGPFLDSIIYVMMPKLQVWSISKNAFWCNTKPFAACFQTKVSGNYIVTFLGYTAIR